MRMNLVLTVFRKELRETLRDRRTLLMMVGVPVLVYPLMIFAVNMIVESKQQQLAERTLTIATWGHVPADVAEALRSARLDVTPGLGLPAGLATDLAAGRVAIPQGGASEAPEREKANPVLDAARTTVGRKSVMAVVVLWPGFDRALAEGQLGRLTVYYDSVSEDSRAAQGRIVSALEKLRKKIVDRRARDLHLDEGFAEAIEIMVRNVASRQQQVGGFIGGLLPLLLIAVSASGGFYAAIDLTAGEKERNTMQTLLCAPLTSAEIVVGKFLTVWVVVMVSGLANLVSMAATFARVGSAMGGLKLPLPIYGIAFIALVPLAVTMSGIFLAVAVFARDFKDGQNLLTPVLLGVVMPAIVPIIPGVELDPVTAFVPIVNVALLIKALFIGKAAGDALFLAVVASSVYAGLALLLAARVFGREQVLLGGREGFRALVGIDEWRGRAPSPGLALSVFAVALVVVFYGSRLFERQGPLVQVVATEYGFFALPIVALALVLGLRWRDTFALRWPSWRSLGGAFLIGVSGWAVIGGTAGRLISPPPEFARKLAESLLLGGGVPLWALLLLVAVTPGLCEELFFRGFVLSGLRAWGPWVSLGLSSLLFGLVHGSIYRLLPTFLLGLLFGYAVWRSGSIACGMLAHMLNNGIGIAMLRHAAASGGLDSDATRQALANAVPWEWTLVGAVVLAAGLWLVPRPERAAPSPSE
jgi:sodium transport system permease protein